MSILRALAQTAATFGWPVAAAFLLLTGASVWAARTARVFRPERVLGPLRWRADESLSLFLALIACGYAAMAVGGSIMYELLGRLPEEQRTQLASPFVGIFTFACIVGASAAFRDCGVDRLGLRAARAPRGLLSGLVGIIIVLPWIFWLMLLALVLAGKLGIPLDPKQTEHPIFRMWQEPGATRLFRILSLISALAIAPLAEESFYRGLVQTALLRAFSLRRFPGPISAQEPAPSSGPPPGVLDNATGPAALPPMMRWAAIIGASALFASMHRPWFILPPIFLLSLGLGYVYERTGNLWASIFMHMLFNGSQFAIFLLTRT